MTAVLGLDDAGDAVAGSAAGGAAARALEALVEDRIVARTEARRARDWAQADAIRDGLTTAGITLEDSADGVRWSLAGD